MQETLYLLPGLLCDKRVWEHQAKHLSDIVDIRIPDFSDMSSLESMAEAVLNDAPETFYVAGHSMGGRVALQILSMAPERISKLALLDTGLHPAVPGEKDKRQVSIDIAVEKGMNALARKWSLPMVHPDRHKDEVLMKAIFDMVERHTTANYKNQIQALLTRPDARAFLAKAPKDSLVLCGREDAWSPPAQHDAISQAMPDQPAVVIIEHSGHMSTMEQPEAVTEAMRSWLLKA